MLWAHSCRQKPWHALQGAAAKTRSWPQILDWEQECAMEAVYGPQRVPAAVGYHALLLSGWL